MIRTRCSVKAWLLCFVDGPRMLGSLQEVLPSGALLGFWQKFSSVCQTPHVRHISFLLSLIASLSFKLLCSTGILDSHLQTVCSLVKDLGDLRADLRTSSFQLLMQP